MQRRQIDVLREIALDQHGFVTTAQAVREGIPSIELVKMFSRGRIARVARGVYRVPHMPQSRVDQFQLARLWTGNDNAVISHESALELWEVGDLIPQRIHVTLPRSSRIRRNGGDDYVVHYADIDSSDVRWVDGIPVVSIEVAIQQVIGDDLPTAFINSALDEAENKNFLSTKDVVGLRSELVSRDEELG